MIDNSIRRLVCYGKENALFDARDEVYVTNRLLEALKLDEINDFSDYSDVNLDKTLGEILDFAVNEGLINDTVTERDLFDTKLTGCLLPPPSAVENRFFEIYKTDKKAATDYYYNLAVKSNYIRAERIKRDLKWTAESEYGTLDITVNLSKPEKDPKEIAAAKSAKQSGYPKCLICKECEGYGGRLNFPARQNHRVISLKLGGEDWFFQYSPYVYYNEHCIVFNSEHIPMKVDRTTFLKLLDFVKQFPHYFLGSNAGLPVVGGSILSHEHYQGGNYVFPMQRAKTDFYVDALCKDGVTVAALNWPMAALRIESEDENKVIDTACKILECWENYTDETVGIYAFTDGERHNTVTPIARMNGKKYQLDVVFRNNLTTSEHPLGVFHPHEKLHHIKKENIGLIEVMGLAVLPSRLKAEMEKLENAIVGGLDINSDPDIAKHAEWAEELKQKYVITKDNVHGIIEKEIGEVFKLVLEDAGVFKRDQKGMAAFKKFLSCIK